MQGQIHNFLKKLGEADVSLSRPRSGSTILHLLNRKCVQTEYFSRKLFLTWLESFIYLGATRPALGALENKTLASGTNSWSLRDQLLAAPETNS